MKRKFYIDRQFGQPIWIETENGIVTDVTNESEKYIAKMLENYKGKTISFLKEDFEKRMQPSFHCVKPEKYIGELTKEKAAESRLRNVKSIIFNTQNGKATPEQEKAIKEEENNIYIAKIAMEAELNILKEQFGFDWKEFVEKRNKERT